MDHDAAKRMLNQIGSGWDILIYYACTMPYDIYVYLSKYKLG